MTQDRKGREVVLANGVVSASIDTANAEVAGLSYRGHDMISRTGRHKNLYFSRDGGELEGRRPAPGAGLRSRRRGTANVRVSLASRSR